MELFRLLAVILSEAKNPEILVTPYI